MAGSFTFFDHTGDIGFALDAPTLPDLFEAGAAGLMAALLAEPGAITRSSGSRPVTLTATALDLLLVDWLSELLFLFDGEAWLVHGAAIDIRAERDAYRLDALLCGEPFDPVRHEVRVLIKAVTYHGLEVRRDGDQWRARVVLDI